MSAIAVGEQEVFMFSGLERHDVAHCRQRRVTWAWVEARSAKSRQAAQRNTMLTTSVLYRDDYGVSAEQVANWRDKLAAITYRKLARKICEHFYDLAVFQARRRGRMADAVTVSRMLSPALPSYCRNAVAAQRQDVSSEQTAKARILTSVLPARNEKGGAVLIPLKSKAA